MLPSSYLIEGDLWLFLVKHFFVLVKSNIYIYIYFFFFTLFHVYFLFTYFHYVYIFCSASVFSRTTELTVMCFTLQTTWPSRKCQFWNKWSEEVIARHSSVCGPWGGQSVYLSQLFGPRTQAELGLYLMLSGNKFWFCLVTRWLPQVISFPIGLSPRTMQDLGFV